MKEERIEYVGKIGYREGEDNIGLVKRLMWDIPESFGDEMDVKECAYPQSCLRRIAAMCRKIFLGFYLETDYNMAFYKMIEYFLLTDVLKDDNTKIKNDDTKPEDNDTKIKDGGINSRMLEKNEWQLSLRASEINRTVHFYLDTWLLENGPLSPEREKAEKRELDIGIILWMADVYALLSWAYSIPFYCLPCFSPQSLYESYQNERFMEVTVYDAAKLIYARHYEPFNGSCRIRGKWEQRALDGFNPGF